jgi:hypothetical protein
MRATIQGRERRNPEAAVVAEIGGWAAGIPAAVAGTAGEEWAALRGSVTKIAGECRN